MFFYGLFALALWRRQQLALATGLMLGSLVALGGVYPGFYTSPIILESRLGIVIGRTYERLAVPTSAAVLLIVAGLAGLMSNDSIPVHAASAAAIVLGALLWERSGKLALWQPGVALGDASYALYLTHIFVLGLTRTLWLAVFHDRPGGVLGAAGLAVFSAVVVLAGALACYRFLEAPMTATLQRRWVATARMRAAAPPLTMA
jgi:peptidoglycan/LPS O-acetylase OafA/YrhL